MWIRMAFMWIVVRGRSARCSVSKVHIISLAFKWLIALRLALKIHDQMHQVLSNAFPTPIKYIKTHVYVSSMKADHVMWKSSRIWTWSGNGLLHVFLVSELEWDMENTTFICGLDVLQTSKCNKIIQPWKTY